MDPQVIIFAIESAVKLGRKIYDVLIDESSVAPMALPLGDLFGEINETEAVEFFRLSANKHLVAEGGPYHGWTPKQLVEAKRTVRAVAERLDAQLGAEEAPEVLQAIYTARFGQVTAEFGPRHPAQRIVGTIIEIGIDYVQANPRALGRESSARKILHAFISSLDATDFAEGTYEEIVADVLAGALETLDLHLTLVADDKRLQMLVGGVTKALAADLAEAKASGSASIFRSRSLLLKRLSTAVLKGGAAAFTENIDLFIPKDGKAATLVQATLTNILKGLPADADLFTAESIELVFKGALAAVSENPSVVTDSTVLQELLSRTSAAIAAHSGRGKLFSEEMLSAVLVEALRVVRDNAEMLIDADSPEKQLLATAVDALAESLERSLAGNGRVRDILSRGQVVELTRLLFEEVAKQPEALLGGADGDPKKTAVAQIISSVARALGRDPTRLVTGSGFVELIRSTIPVAVQNLDKLVDLETDDPTNNLLFEIFKQVVDGVASTGDVRGLVTRDVFLDIVARVLPVASANIEGVTRDQPSIRDAITTTLGLASGVLEGRINGANLPRLTEQILAQVLWGELRLDEAAAVERAARAILRAI